MVIPLRTALFDRATGKHGGEQLLVLTEARADLHVHLGFAAPPVLSINRAVVGPGRHRHGRYDRRPRLPRRARR
jgi:aminopeptidase N